MRRTVASLLIPMAAASCNTVLSYTTPDAAQEAGHVGATDAACGSPTDPENCGACGHSCLGGACSGGICQPVVLASGQGPSIGTWGAAAACADAGAPVAPCAPDSGALGGPDAGLPVGYCWQDAGVSYTECGPDGGVLTGPTALATDGTNVFWIDVGGEVMRVPVTGGATVRVTSTAAAPSGIGLDDQYVYFSSQETESIYRVAKLGGAPVSLTPVPAYGFAAPVISFVVSNDSLYWVDGVLAYKCPSSGCTGAPRQIWDPKSQSFTSESPGAIAVYGSALYVAAQWDFSGDAGSFLASGITCPMLGAVNGPLDLQYYEIQADSEHVYALSNSAVLRGSCATNSEPTFLASGELPPYLRGLALDASYVYWIALSGSAWTGSGTMTGPSSLATPIMRCAKTGCVSPEVLDALELNAIDLATDNVAVYWTTGDGKVKKLAKPGPSTASIH
jgi:hypothetical protein